MYTTSKGLDYCLYTAGKQCTVPQAPPPGQSVCYEGLRAAQFKSPMFHLQAAKIVRDAAVAAGAPEGIICWVDSPSLPVSQALMAAPEVSLILATGGPAMVRAAYSSGHPSLGVGAGNTPAVIDETASIKMAVSSIMLSKTFDNGVICASEQSVVVCEQVRWIGCCGWLMESVA